METTVAPEIANNARPPQPPNRMLLRSTKHGGGFLAPKSGSAVRLDVFSTLVQPIDASIFFETKWEQQPLHITGRPFSHYESLVSTDLLDQILTSGPLSGDDISLTRAVDPPDPGTYTLASGSIDPIAVYNYFAAGFTVVFNHMHTKIPALSRLCAALCGELGMRFQTNIYLTPPDAGGFNVHYDTHDVFILQVAGAKTWELFDSPLVLPLPGQDHVATGLRPGDLAETVHVQAGDLLYIPRGVYHRGRTSSVQSLHITFGAIARSWTEFLFEALAEISLRDPSFRKSLPIGFESQDCDLAGAELHFKTLMRKLSENSRFIEVTALFQEEFACRRHIYIDTKLASFAGEPTLSANSIIQLDATPHIFQD